MEGAQRAKESGYAAQKDFSIPGSEPYLARFPVQLLWGNSPERKIKKGGSVSLVPDALRVSRFPGQPFGVRSLLIAPTLVSSEVLAPFLEGSPVGTTHRPSAG